jgi:predicted molibdopterin-dependent oxidoreductase YjgC
MDTEYQSMSDPSESRGMRFGRPESVGLPVWFVVDGEPCPAQAGETIAAALYALGVRAWRGSRNGEPRGLLCGIGLCFDCLVTVDGEANVRACLTEVREGMLVETSLPKGRQP